MTFGPGETAETSISANAESNRKAIIVLYGWNVDAGDATSAGIDLVRRGYNGDHVTGYNVYQANTNNRALSYSVVNGHIAVTAPTRVGQVTCTMLW